MIVICAGSVSVYVYNFVLCDLLHVDNILQAKTWSSEDSEEQHFRRFDLMYTLLSSVRCSVSLKESLILGEINSNFTNYAITSYWMSLVQRWQPCLELFNCCCDGISDMLYNSQRQPIPCVYKLIIVTNWIGVTVRNAQSKTAANNGSDDEQP